MEDGAVGCGTVSPGPGAPILQLTAAPAAKFPTVINLSWKTASPTRGTVRFGLTPGLEMPTLSSSGLSTTHSVVLKGLPAASKVSYRLEVKSASGACHRAAASVTTGPLPADLPQLILDTSIPAEAAGGFTVVPVIGAQESWVVILDSKGQVVWSYKSYGHFSRARLSLDRKAILVSHSGSGEKVPGQIIRVPLDGSPETETSINGIHTDFLEVEKGTYAALSKEVRTYNGGTRKLLGETIVEVSAEGGPAKVVWRAFDNFVPDLTRNYPKGQYIPDPQVESWSHVNSLSYAAKERAYFTTARELNAVIKVSRDTGKTLWTLGNGNVSSINTGNDKTMVDGPHSAVHLEDGVLVFNNGDAMASKCSSVTEMEIKNGAAKKTWSYIPTPCHKVLFLGNAERLANGNTLVNWTTSGRIEEVTRAKKLVWGVHTAIGAGFGFATRVKSLYE